MYPMIHEIFFFLIGRDKDYKKILILYWIFWIFFWLLYCIWNKQYLYYV